MPGKRRKPQERALYYAAIMGDASFEKVNELLAAAEYRPVPITTYEMLRDKYVPVFRLPPPALLEAITNPKNLTHIAQYWRKDAKGEWEFVLPDDEGEDDE